MTAKPHFDSVSKLWRGPEVKLFDDFTVSLGQSLMDSLARNPNGVGQIYFDDGSEMKNSEILRNSTRAALNLRDLGLKEGNVIGIAAKNSKYLSSIILGAFALGTPVNTIDPTFQKSDIAHMFVITEPEIVLCDTENFPEVRQALKDIHSKAPIYLFGWKNEGWGTRSVSELLAEHPEEESFRPPAITDGSTLPAAIVCSSGTTGPSKGVVLSHANILNQLDNLGDCQGTFLCFSSLYWLSGMLTLITTMAHNITRLVTVQSFSPDLMLKMVKKHKVTHLLTPPLQLALTLQRTDLDFSDLDSVLQWLCGGGHVPEENGMKINKLMKNGHITIGYGCSEIGGLATKTNARLDSVGQLVSGVSLKIIDEAGENLGVGERGEICLKPKYPNREYFRNPEATKESFKDEWFYTGDIGIMDEGGELHIVDRKKDIMKVGNYQIDPSELEMVIQKIPEVILVSVFGLPDPVYMDLPVAVIVKAADSSLTEGQVQDFVQENLPSYKWLKGGVYFVDRMPITPSGKIMKRKCRELVISKGLK